MTLLDRKGVYLWGGLSVSAGILALLAAGHWEGIAAAFAGASPAWLAAAALAAALSYALVGLALRDTLVLLGHRLEVFDSLRIGFVSTAVNYVLSSAGLSGFALKAWLLRRRRVPYGTLVTASALTSVFFYGVMLLLMAQGLFVLTARLGGSRLEVAGGVAALSASVLLVFAVGAAFFHHEFRGRLGLAVFHAVNHLLFFFSKAAIPRERFDEFDAQIADGLREIRRSGWRLAWPVAYTCGDWFCALVALDASFRAIGWPLEAGTLLAAFSVGMLTTVVPVLPAGMGAMEGAMAAVFARSGIPWDAALAGSLIFRTAYYLLPGALSVVWLWLGRGGLAGGFAEEAG